MPPPATPSAPPLLTADPGRQYEADRHLIEPALKRVLESGQYILGHACAAFESSFAAYLGAEGCVGTASGTDALELAVRALGLGAGDEVVVPALTSSATATAVVRAGAIPVIADVEPDYLTLCPQALSEVLGPRTRAIVPVHLYGHPCRMDALERVTRTHDLACIEDCAQAHGARWDGRKVGTFGDAAAFSFYPTKNLAALGDAGALVSQRGDVVERASVLRQYGWIERQVSSEVGMNTRLDELQAAILSARLGLLDERNARRQQIAERYASAFAPTGMTLPATAERARPVYHQYVIRHPERDALLAFLADQGILAGVLYRVPIHLQGAFSDCRRGSLRVAERAARELLCLPIHAELQEDEVERVIDAVLLFGRLGT